nr:immunoglobulin light chain junction region [Mus musculus]NSL97237.1 immunoglobulin light chain junction region [Mus musculus]NSL97582.1 immunoglobulin light chain junction region [Mus musculus]NSL97934.1 immunoglobulin light chain junction region [Mus musculus]NSL98933.1 immunoglobulin light chain junction region [Mus musculus]
CLQGTHQPWTF